MAFFGLFKKKKVEEVVEKEVVSQDGIFEWLEEKKKYHLEGEEEFLKPIKELIYSFIAKLKLDIYALENIDFDVKKADSRVKSIVKENLRNYIGYLEKIIERLGKIDEREKIVEKINFVFDDFHKRTRICYEKVTFLVGKEMQATKDSIEKFLADLEIVLKNNAKDFKEFEMIGLLEKDVLKFKHVEGDRKRILSGLKESSRKVEKLEEELKDKEKEIVDLKDSAKFKEEEKKKEGLMLKRRVLEKEIYSLSSLIDFKMLTSFYHKFEKEMKWVKEYRDNFRQGLKSLGFEKLVNLLKDAKLNNEKIEELIRKIRDKEKEILDFKIDDFGLGDLEREVGRVREKIREREYEKEVQEKKLKSLEEEMERIIGVVIGEFEKIGVSVE